MWDVTINKMKKVNVKNRNIYILIDLFKDTFIYLFIKLFIY